LRWLALIAGVALAALALAAVTRVTDTREGLIAEVVTLFAALAAVALLIYAFAARKDFRPRPVPHRESTLAEAPTRSRRDVALGAGGLGLAALLVAGLAVSGGVLWAGLGVGLLLPMIAGSLYLCVRFLRSAP